MQHGCNITVLKLRRFWRGSARELKLLLHALYWRLQGFFSVQFYTKVQFWVNLCSSIQWNVQLLCYIGAKYHIVISPITRKLNLFLRKSIKLLPPDLLPLAQIYTKSFVGWGFAPDPTEGAYSAPPDPLAGLRGPTSKGRGGKGRESKGKEGEGKGPTSKGTGGEEREGSGGDGMRWKGKGEGGEGREEGDGWTNPKPAATGLQYFKKSY